MQLDWRFACRSRFETLCLSIFLFLFGFILTTREYLFVSVFGSFFLLFMFFLDVTSLFEAPISLVFFLA